MGALHTSVALALLSLRQLAPHDVPIGTINFLDGGVQVISPTSARLATAGMLIGEGDTIKTARNAWALLSMCDGARMMLRPSTQLRFEVYQYDPQKDPSESASLLSLTVGAFRSITGFIGQQNPSAYMIVTPTALIGIRGTDHEPAYFPAHHGAIQQAGTYDKVNAGRSFISNARGELDIEPGQTGFAADDAKSEPSLLTQTPTFYPDHALFDKRFAAIWRDLYRRLDESRHLDRRRSTQFVMNYDPERRQDDRRHHS